MYESFMGFPVFNAAIGIADGPLAARRAVIWSWSRIRALRGGRRVAITMTWVLGELCVTTAWTALGEATVGEQVRGMLRLLFVDTQPMIYGLIAGGGTGLSAFHHLATLLTTEWFAPPA
jgi:hypothetical protein